MSLAQWREDNAIVSLKAYSSGHIPFKGSYFACHISATVAHPQNIGLFVGDRHHGYDRQKKSLSPPFVRALGSL
ncbi:hypothetical protein BT93_F2874 [Corymbia citriodora subsp. variegata]|nr:hypothetical protein BT93_F2874 [Corymbia citriodora subsp. variegata]